MNNLQGPNFPGFVTVFAHEPRLVTVLAHD
jgi:hypothetical protein